MSANIRFEEFELDLATEELRRNGGSLKLPRQAVRLLCLLASRPGQLVSREEIQHRIWGEETFVDFEQGINKFVRQIRHALGDDAEAPRFVETLPRRGYRFIATVDGLPLVHRRPLVDEPLPNVHPAGAAHRAKRFKGARRWTALLAAGVAALAITFVVVLFRARTPIVHSIAVLPLANLSGDPSQDWLVDGLTEQLTTELGRMSSLRVISRTSSMRFKHSEKSVPEIARELQVDAVIKGSVTRVGDRIRVTAQLIQAATDRHLWASSYERDSLNILALQDEVARGIARETGVRLTSHERPKGGGLVSPEAYEAYLMGRQSWGTRTQAGLPCLLRLLLGLARGGAGIQPSYSPQSELCDCSPLVRASSGCHGKVG